MSAFTEKIASRRSIALALLAALVSVQVTCAGGSVPTTNRCSDGVENGDETGGDCGGPDCAPCSTSNDCGSDFDCDSGYCDLSTGMCVESACEDDIQNGDETGLDCGGPDCDACPDGENCSENADCTSDFCDTATGICTDSGCTDGVLGGEETDMDCGGPDCYTCEAGQKCLVNTDCTSNLCEITKGICNDSSCSDGAQNGGETGTDCGGSDCNPCADGENCSANSDCSSNYCSPVNSVCSTPNCSDGEQNGNETDLDCGGPQCDACPNGGTCADNGDCASDHCDNTTRICTAVSCTDGARNSGETDVDCGGPDCYPCAVGLRCLVNTDCTSSVCENTTARCAAPSCSDGAQNGDETGRDCGGPDCARCPTGQACIANTDCLSNYCSPDKNICRTPNCFDKQLNGTETDVDCGGSKCNSCVDGNDCRANTDCVSKNCDQVTHTCSAPTCSDGLKNGGELGRDCGGPCPNVCWTKGPQGHSCTTTCAAVGATCVESALSTIDTAEEISAIASALGVPCSTTIAWSYDTNPGQCTASTCCGSTPCVNLCAYGTGVQQTCSAPSVGYTRFCPCR